MSQRQVRLGLILPATNTTVEADFGRALHRIATVHSARLRLAEGKLDATSLAAMNDRLEEAAGHLASARVDYIVYASTAGGFFGGPGYDRDLIERVTTIARVPGTAASIASIEALQSLGAHAVSVVSPYNDWESARLQEYLQAAGLTVASIASDPVGRDLDGRGHNDLSPASALSFASTACAPDADALYCACTAWRAMEIAEELEHAVQRPVVTSNQALIWCVIRDLGLPPINGFGRLLAGSPRS